MAMTTSTKFSREEDEKKKSGSFLQLLLLYNILELPMKSTIFPFFHFIFGMSRFAQLFVLTCTILSVQAKVCYHFAPSFTYGCSNMVTLDENTLSCHSVQAAYGISVQDLQALNPHIICHGTNDMDNTLLIDMVKQEERKYSSKGCMRC